MSKAVKKLQMDAIRKKLVGVRDLLVMNITGVSAKADNTLRLNLRKKNIHVHVVKNSLVSLIFKEMGIVGVDAHLAGPTTLAWGSASIADLAKEFDALAKKEKKILFKTAVAEGVAVPFEDAKKFPTREEAIAKVVSLILAPAARVAGQLRNAGGRIAGQIKTLSEKTEGEAAPAAAPVQA
jgi:large subunit ribosomal protein L10